MDRKGGEIDAREQKQEVVNKRKCHKRIEIEENREEEVERRLREREDK